MTPSHLLRLSTLVFAIVLIASVHLGSVEAESTQMTQPTFGRGHTRRGKPVGRAPAGETARSTFGRGAYREKQPSMPLRGLMKDEETPPPTPAPTVSPTKKPMGGKNKDTVSPTEAPVTNSDDDESDDDESDEDVTAELGEPTRSPTRDPTSEPTKEPTYEPTKEPTAEPTSEPTYFPTSEPTAFPTSAPTYSPSSSPSQSPSAAPTLTQHKVILNEFSILLISPNGPVHVAELERTLTDYILDGILFDNIKSVGLDIVEGNSVTEEPEKGSNTATSVRFAAWAIFNSFLPPLMEIRAEQTYLLEQREDLQAHVSQNPGLAGAEVTDVSFERIDSKTTFEDEDKNKLDKNSSIGIGILVVVVVVSSLSIFGGVLALRLFKVTEKKTSSLDKAKPKKSRKQKMKEETPKGCASLVSGSVSLGGDSRMTSQYQYPCTLNGIVIETMDSMDEDDAYLTMDEDIANAIEGL